MTAGIIITEPQLKTAEHRAESGSRSQLPPPRCPKKRMPWLVWLFVGGSTNNGTKRQIDTNQIKQTNQY